MNRLIFSKETPVTTRSSNEHLGKRRLQTFSSDSTSQSGTQTEKRKRFSAPRKRSISPARRASRSSNSQSATATGVQREDTSALRKIAHLNSLRFRNKELRRETRSSTSSRVVEAEAARKHQVYAMEDDSEPETSESEDETGITAIAVELSPQPKAKNLKIEEKVRRKRRHTRRVKLSVFPKKQLVPSRPGAYITSCENYLEKIKADQRKLLRQKGCILDKIWGLEELEKGIMERYGHLKNVKITTDDQLDQKNDVLDMMEDAIINLQKKIGEKLSQRDSDRFELQHKTKARKICCKACNPTAT